MNKFVTGIDDIGTMSGKSEGWTFISFHHDLLNDFNNTAKDILTRSRLKSFHAKEFKRNKSDFYLEFLNLIRSTLSKGTNSFLCCTLLDEEWKTQFRDFCDNVIDQSFQSAGIDNVEIIDASKKLAAPLFTYQRIASTKIAADFTSIDIDSDSVLKRIRNAKLIVNGKTIPSQLPICASLNAYKSKRFPSAPQIHQDSIMVLDDEESFLIQAADIFGNFSTALAFKTLGKQSKTNDVKCQLFLDVFGDLLDTSQISSVVGLAGDDLVLRESGSFTFCVN